MAYGETVARKSDTLASAERKQRVITHIRSSQWLREYMRDEAWRIMTKDPKLNTANNWEADALCDSADPDSFFIEKGQSAHPAREICFGCAVREACLVDAMVREDSHAIRGGMTARERKLLAKRLEVLNERRAAANQ